MEVHSSLFKYDVGYREYYPGKWLPSKIPPEGKFTWTDKAIEAASKVDISDADVLSATFPKTGQTWTMAIMSLIKGHQDILDGKEVASTDYFDKIQFLEVEYANGETGAEKIQKLDAPRLIKTHLPIQKCEALFEKYPKLKVVQTIRNPKDTLVSMFHFLKKEIHSGEFTGTWDQFFDFILSGKGFYGEFFQFQLDWYKFLKGRENALIIKYEDMKRDHRGHVVKLAKFMGYQDLPDSVIDYIVEKTTAKTMNTDVQNMMKIRMGGKEPRIKFVRKGEVGDWVNYFTQEQSDLVEAKCKEYFEPVGLTFDYSI